MRSFSGRDILSLKDFERNEFFRIFEIAEKGAFFLTKTKYSKTVIASRRRSNPVVLPRLLRSLRSLAMTRL